MDTVREVTVKEAATVLGLSREGVRKRLQRGTLSGRKTGMSWTVFLPAGPRMRDTSTVQEQDTGQNGPTEDGTPALVEALKAQVEYLQRENERKDTIIMALAQRVPQLPAPAPETERPQGGRWWWPWGR